MRTHARTRCRRPTPGVELNVLKIKPALCFDRAAADYFLTQFTRVFEERAQSRTASAIVLVVTALGLAVTNMLNLHGGMLNLITGLSTFVKIPNSFRTRAGMMLPTLVIGLGLAVTASQDFTGNPTAFLSFLLLLPIPWGAVNLVDFYLVQHGEYDVPGMYTRGGKTGAIRPRGPTTGSTSRSSSPS